MSGGPGRPPRVDHPPTPPGVGGSSCLPQWYRQLPTAAGSTFGLVYTAPVTGFGGSNLGPAIDRTLTPEADHLKTRASRLIGS
jgi:hypothetical protein